MEIKLTPKSLKEMMSEYTFNTGNTEYNDDMIELLDSYNTLPEADRVILTLYAETGSLRKTAKTLGVSYATVRKTIASIRHELFGNLNKNFRKDNIYD